MEEERASINISKDCVIITCNIIDDLLSKIVYIIKIYLSNRTLFYRIDEYKSLKEGFVK